MTHLYPFSTSLLPFKRMALASAMVFMVSASLAADLAGIRALISAGKQPDALTLINKELGVQPKDPQLRFLKGLVLADMGRQQEALPVFVRLTEDFPKFPEPYNNLAVLYAQQGQFDKAKLALESAIRTNPSYATAHENLGDVYTRMASVAYSQALQLDVNKTQVPPKLALIRDLTGISDNRLVAGGTVAAVPVAPVTPVAAKPPSPLPAPVVAPAKPASVATAIAKPAPVPPVAVKPAPPVVATASTPVVQPTVKPTTPVTTNETEVKAEAAAKKQVEAALDTWVSAWSSKNFAGYIGAYTPEFVPASGGTHKAWEEDRRIKVLGKSRISVTVSNVSVSVEGSNAVVRFRQNYSADALQTATRKTLHMTKRGSKWLISKEISG